MRDFLAHTEIARTEVRLSQSSLDALHQSLSSPKLVAEPMKVEQVPPVSASVRVKNLPKGFARKELVEEMMDAGIVMERDVKSINMADSIGSDASCIIDFDNDTIMRSFIASFDGITLQKYGKVIAVSHVGAQHEATSAGSDCENSTDSTNSSIEFATSDKETTEFQWHLPEPLKIHLPSVDRADGFRYMEAQAPSTTPSALVEHLPQGFTKNELIQELADGGFIMNRDIQGVHMAADPIKLPGVDSCIVHFVSMFVLRSFIAAFDERRLQNYDQVVVVSSNLAETPCGCSLGINFQARGMYQDQTLIAQNANSVASLTQQSRRFEYFRCPACLGHAHMPANFCTRCGTALRS